jgi:hypothetical protein
MAENQGPPTTLDALETLQPNDQRVDDADSVKQDTAIFTDDTETLTRPRRQSNVELII